MVPIHSPMLYTQEKAVVGGRQDEVYIAGLHDVGREVLQDGRLQQIWLFLQAPKSAARSSYEPGQRLSVLGGSHTSIRLALPIFARVV
jgi:hypothetical protein